jgi:type I restriction enzyme S subunit
MKKKSKRTLKPKLRFPEFRGAPEWLEIPLGEMSDRIVEKVGDATLTPVSITAGQGFVSQVEKFGRDISGAQYKNYIWLRQGDFSYNKGNSKSYPQGCVRRLKEFDQAAAPSAFVSFRLHDQYIPEFFEGLFEKNVHGQQLIKFITSSARSDGLLNINPDEFFSVNLPMPQDPAEQQKIAEFLSTLDGLIAAEGRTLETLKAHKKGLMQQLFPQPGQTQPRLRFPEFRDKPGWGENTLGRLADFASGGTPSKADPKFWDGEIPWISASAMHDTAVYDSELRVTQQAIGNGTRLATKGSILILVRGSMLFKRVPICIAEKDVAFNQDVKSICPKHGVVTRYLLNQLIALESRIEINATGIGAGKIDTEHLKSLAIGVPSSTEQQKIADCLSNLDTQIVAQVDKIDALKTHKRGLMQQLFPTSEEFEA